MVFKQSQSPILVPHGSKLLGCSKLAEETTSLHNDNKLIVKLYSSIRDSKILPVILIPFYL